MQADVIESSAQFRKVQTQLRRRLVNRSLEQHPLQVVYVGDCYRARIEGSSISAFGTDPSEARQRVTKLATSRSFCALKQCDQFDDFFERFGFYNRRDPRSKRGQV
jgi:hypothetical protein